MNVPSILTPRKSLTCFLLVLAFIPSEFVWGADADSDPRVKEAMEELAAVRDLASVVSDEREIAIWSNRLEIAEQTLHHAKRMVDLEIHEASLAKKQRMSEEFTIREAIRKIDPKVDDSIRAVSKLNERIRRLTEQKAGVEGRKLERVITEDDTVQEAERSQQAQTLDSEILALSLERDQEEIKIRLAKEATRVETSLREREYNPRPTIRLLVGKNREIEAATKQSQDYDLWLKNLQARRHEILLVGKLGEQRFSLLDDEIGILQEKYSVERRANVASEDEREAQDERRRRIRNMLNNAKSEKKWRQRRIPHYRSQFDVITSSIQLLTQARDLLDLEAGFLKSEFLTIRKSYSRVIVVPGTVILGIVLIYLAISRLVLPRVLERDDLFLARRLGSYGALMFVVIVLASFFLEDLKAIATIMGLAGAAIVIALQDLCSSFAGWFVIIASRKVSVGDRVEIDGHRGDVLDIQLLRITMLELNNWLGIDEPTGRILTIPNSFIFKSNVFNYSHMHEYVWGRLDIVVTFETPPQEAHDVLFNILKEETVEEFKIAAESAISMEDRYGVPDTVYEPKIHSSIDDSGVTFMLFYVCHYNNISRTKSKLNKRILEEFDNHPRLEFAYPTQRHIPTPEEGGFPVSVEK